MILTKCLGADCSKKESCLRFLIKPRPEQDFFINEPINDENKCEYYIKEERTNDDRRED